MASVRTVPQRKIISVCASISVQENLCVKVSLCENISVQKHACLKISLLKSMRVCACVRQHLYLKNITVQKYVQKTCQCVSKYVCVKVLAPKRISAQKNLYVTALRKNDCV